MLEEHCVSQKRSFSSLCQLAGSTELSDHVPDVVVHHVGLVSGGGDKASAGLII